MLVARGRDLEGSLSNLARRKPKYYRLDAISAQNDANCTHGVSGTVPWEQPAHHGVTEKTFLLFYLNCGCKQGSKS